MTAESKLEEAKLGATTMLGSLVIEFTFFIFNFELHMFLGVGFY